MWFGDKFVDTITVQHRMLITLAGDNCWLVSSVHGDCDHPSLPALAMCSTGPSWAGCPLSSAVFYPGAWPDIPRSQAGDWTMSCPPPLYFASDGGPAVSGASEGTRFHQLGAGLLREFLASVRVEMLPIVNECIIFFSAEKMIQFTQFTRQNTVDNGFSLFIFICLLAAQSE